MTKITAMLIYMIETALFQFFVLRTKVEERSSEKVGRNEIDRSVLINLIGGNMNVFTLYL